VYPFFANMFMLNATQWFSMMSLEMINVEHTRSLLKFLDYVDVNMT